MFQVGVLLGGEENNTRRQMADVIEFETKLANITQPAEDLRDEEKLYHLMSVKDLQRKAPFVSERKYLRRTLQREFFFFSCLK